MRTPRQAPIEGSPESFQDSANQFPFRDIQRGSRAALGRRANPVSWWCAAPVRWTSVVFWPAGPSVRCTACGSLSSEARSRAAALPV